MLTFQGSTGGLGTTGIGLTGIGPVLGATASNPLSGLGSHSGGNGSSGGESPPGVIGATSLGTSIEPTTAVGGNGATSILPPGGIGLGLKPPSPEQPLFMCPRRPNIGREGRSIGKNAFQNLLGHLSMKLGIFKSFQEFHFTVSVY